MTERTIAAYRLERRTIGMSQAETLAEKSVAGLSDDARRAVRRRLQRRADRLDLAYGAICCSVTIVWSENP